MKRTLLPLFSTLLFFLFPLLSSSLLAQSLQPIRVMEYNEKSNKTPLANVGVTVANAGAAMSDAQGEATLRFRTLLAGDHVQVRRIEMAGYEIFNQDAIDQWAISPTHPFQIVMCRSDRFRDLREQYLRVASASYDKQLKADKARLDKERKKSKMLEEEYQRRLQELQDQYDQQLEDLDNYVDHFARIDLSELTSQEQHLIELVQEGRIDEAIQLYESHDYVGQYQREAKEIAEIDRAQQRLAEIEEQKRAEREAILASIDRQVSTYTLAGGIENWAKIMALLRSVADADTTNYKAVYQFALYALNQNLLDESEKYFSICYRATTDDMERARLINRQADLCAMRLQIPKAIELYQQAIDLCESKAGQDSTRFLEDLVLFQGNLHSLYCLTGDYDAQLSISPILIDRAQRLAQEESTIVSNLALAESEYALAIACQQGDFAKANEIADHAFALTKQLPSNDQKTDTDLKQILNVLVFVYEVQEAWEKQLPILREAVSVLEKQYARNPERTRVNLLEAYNNLADTYLTCEQWAEIPELLQKCQDLIPDLQKQLSSNILSVNLMSFYDTSAQYYLAIGNNEESSRYAHLCMEYFDLMPANYQADYAEVKERWTTDSNDK